MYNNSYIVVTDFMPADGKTDISDRLQQLIDENPNRTLFFPDGTYLLSRPILTPANPKKSVDLQLSNFAVLKAADSWNSEEAMIRLGAKDPANDILTPGSNYGLCGGVLDCSGKANGISIDGGRETYVRNCNIKNAVIGLHIKIGANSGSSDADIHSVNITGTGERNSLGVLIEGYDNTLTDMRIGRVFVGVDVRSGGNMLRNIHPLYYINGPTYPEYEESVGFKIGTDVNNWFDYCYSDQFATSFFTERGGNLHNCYCWWYSANEEKHLALRCVGAFHGHVHNLTVGGAHHPDHGNQLSEGMEFADDAVLDTVTVDWKLIKTDK